MGLALLFFARTIYLLNAKNSEGSALAEWFYQYKDEPEGPAIVIRCVGLSFLALGLAIVLFPK